MSGMYGTVKPADINIGNDVEIFYHYRPSYDSNVSDFENFKILNNSYLTNCSTTDGTGSNINISGLFNLKLPLNEFSRKGIYTIYIRPKEVTTTIFDVGVLAAYPDVKGVVLNMDDQSFINGGLDGYRIEFVENGKKTGDFKIITSSNRCTSISYMLSNTSDKGTKYRFDDSGTLIFCTVTPSLAPTFKPNSLPYIGMSGSSIKLVNTKFNPVMIELEIVEHDAETISTMLEGNQLIDKDNALLTVFNKNDEIYHQSEYGSYKDSYGNPLYEFKKKRDNIDFNQSFDNLEN
jgi:hypothetical protein